MNLPFTELLSLLSQSGLTTRKWQFPDGSFETVSEEWVSAVASACLAALPPEIVTVRKLGGGKTLPVPLWVADAGDCETHSLVLAAWGMVGNWTRAVRDRVKRGGTAFGVLFYTATPRPENGYRNGRHSICWFVNHEKQVRFFEFGDNDVTTLTVEEKNSCTFGICA